MSDEGVWVKVYGSGGGGIPVSPAVVSEQSGGTKQSGVTIDGKTYDIYTFTQETTVASVTLTDEARERITDPEIVAAVEAADDPEELLAEYGDVLKDALVVVPASDPGLSMTFSANGSVDILVVGGGGGTFPNSGGGGAGGLLTVSDAYTPAGQVNITVGQGGPASSGAAGPTGFASHFGAYYSPGGDGPYDRKAFASQGGSGAGGSYGSYPGTYGIEGLGNNGGAGASSGASGGGGGGTAAGEDAPLTSTGGDGGDGTDVSAVLGQAAGTTVVAGGGGGWGTTTPGTGGLGGGGNGGTTGSADDGAPNTGGGAGSSAKAGGAAGGSGLVIVRVCV